MKKPAQSLLVAALLLLGGCGVFNPATESDTTPPEPASPAAEAPATPDAASPSPVAESPSPVAAAPNSGGSDVLTNTTVIPGERVGPITATTTREDLAELFGEENLIDESVNVGEGFTQPGTTVDLDEGRSFSIVWTDDSRAEIQEVRNLGPAWTTPQGIGVGTSFSTLENELGPFELYGLGWDYGGTIILEGTELAEYDDSLILRLRPAEGAIEAAPTAFQSVSGDTTFSSTDASFEELDLQVGQMIVYLTPPQ